MNTPAQHPDDEEPTAIRAALCQDARRIEDAPFDPALHWNVLRRIRAMSDVSAPRPQWKLIPAPAWGALAAIVIAALCTPLYVKSPRHSGSPSKIQVASSPHLADRASVWSYESAMAKGDAAFSAALDRDAQALLPSSAASLDLL